MKNKVTYENIRYGSLVEFHHGDGGYHTGVKVHFYNKKGVLIGNYYEFTEYSKLRFKPGGISYPRYFLNTRFEKQKQWLFEKSLRIVDVLLRFTQTRMHWHPNKNKKKK